MKKLGLALAACAALMTMTTAASADIARKINFQGRLADASGTPKTGTFSITFKLWTAATGGTACYTQTQSVAVNSGLFSVNIGDVTGCDFNTPYHLEIKVGTDAAMVPRIALTASGYAFRADDSNKLNGKVTGSAANQIPINSGTLMTSLNADKVDGYDYTTIVNNTLGAVNKVLYQNPASCDASSTVTTTSGTCADTNYGGCGKYGCGTAAATCPTGCTQASYTCANNGCSSGYSRYMRVCNCTKTLLGYVKP